VVLGAGASYRARMSDEAAAPDGPPRTPVIRPDGRVDPPEAGPERDVVGGVLDFLRGTVVMKARGLSDEQARAAACPPSTLTVAGIIGHLTAVERFWFAIDFAGQDLPHPWTPEDPHGAFAPEGTLDELIAAYEAECARSRGIVSANGLDELARSEGMDFSLRYAVAHMIEETGRHCGHLDLLREALDGTTGE
jgi:hypothetical protein